MKLPPVESTSASSIAETVNRQLSTRSVDIASNIKTARKRSILPAKLPVDAIIALIDTREQDPLVLPELRSERATLATGDYSARGLERVCAIERKSLPDLVAVCGRDRDRFEREVMRLLAYPIRALVVESEWADIERGDWRSKITAKSVAASLIAWQTRGLPIVMAGNHQRAGELVSAILRRAVFDRYRDLRDLSREIL